MSEFLNNYDLEAHPTYADLQNTIEVFASASYHTVNQFEALHQYDSAIAPTYVKSISTHVNIPDSLWKPLILPV